MCVHLSLKIIIIFGVNLVSSSARDSSYNNDGEPVLVGFFFILFNSAFAIFLMNIDGNRQLKTKIYSAKQNLIHISLYQVVSRVCSLQRHTVHRAERNTFLDDEFNICLGSAETKMFYRALNIIFGLRMMCVCVGCVPKRQLQPSDWLPSHRWSVRASAPNAHK